MKIDHSSSPISQTGGFGQPVKAAKPSALESDSISFDQVESLAKALREENDVRPDKIKKAQELIANPNWPSSSTMQEISRILSVAQE